MRRFFGVASLLLATFISLTCGRQITLRLKPDVGDSTSRSLWNPNLAALKEAFPLQPVVKIMPRNVVEVQKLNKHRLLSYYTIPEEDFHGRTADEVVEELLRNPAVEEAFEEPEVVSAQTAPNYADCEARHNVCQRYMLPPYDPRQVVGGVNAWKAQKMTGVLGETVTILVLELDKPDSNHEDLKPFSFVVQGRDVHELGYHSTASAGIMLGQHNGFGVEGIAPNANFAYAKYQISEILQLKDYLKAGDVIQVGVHTHFTPRRAYCANIEKCWVPVEAVPLVKDSLTYLTQEVGVHVIIAAGNGNINLDHSAHNGVFNRASDSWVIYAGAVDSRAGGRAYFSNYGSRVDVCSWGFDVTTTTWAEGRHNLYKTDYSGTSSANPIIAGSAAFLQSLARARGLGDLAPNVLRQILVESGHPIPKPLSNQNIGPQPDLVRAVEIIERMAAGGGTTFTTRPTTTTTLAAGSGTGDCGSCSPCIATSGTTWDNDHCAKCAYGARPKDWPCQTPGFCKCAGSAVVSPTTTTTPRPATTTTGKQPLATTTTKGASGTADCGSCSPCVSNSGTTWDDDHCSKCANGARPVDWPCQTRGFCRCK